MEEKYRILIEHYQKSFELTFEMWKQRNRIFLYLLATIGIASLISLKIPQTETLMVYLIAKMTGLTKDTDITNLKNNFPYWEIMTILLILIFYLMVNLFHRAISVLRNYQYLAILETEIRNKLKVPKNSLAFSREGKFYWKDRPKLLFSIKFAYIGSLGILLSLFLYKRIESLIHEGNWFHGGISALIIIPIALYFIAYVIYTVSLDRQ